MQARTLASASGCARGSSDAPNATAMSEERPHAHRVHPLDVTGIDEVGPGHGRRRSSPPGRPPGRPPVSRLPSPKLAAGVKKGVTYAPHCARGAIGVGRRRTPRRPRGGKANGARTTACSQAVRTSERIRQPDDRRATHLTRRAGLCTTPSNRRDRIKATKTRRTTGQGVREPPRPPHWLSPQVARRPTSASSSGSASMGRHGLGAGMADVGRPRRTSGSASVSACAGVTGWNSSSRGAN
jgi:hypothetical protein